MMNELVFTMKVRNRVWKLYFSHTSTEWTKWMCVDVS